MTVKTKRIWELDALRGFCILCMIAIHAVFDLKTFGGVSLNMPGWFNFFRTYGHVFFVLISGICATLASRSFRRGVVVFAVGLLVTASTVFLIYVLDFSESILIVFGILHMLGVCMMVFPLFKRLPVWALIVLGVAFVVLGFWFDTLTVSVKFLFPFGLTFPGFFSGDYFPIFPGLGWYLLGAAIGRTAYKKKESLLPKVNADFFLLRFLRFCGKHSLWFYLLHQPILTGLTLLIF